MKKMVKAAAVLAAILMALTLGACDNGSSSGSGGGNGDGSGSSGGESTNTSENPFGFTEEDNENYFCLDKDGKVLQKVNYSDEGGNVEGAVFLVFWTLYDDTGKVSLYRYYGDYEDVTIPDGVTEIGDPAFYGCSSLASVTIPGSVTRIGKSLFSYIGFGGLETLDYKGTLKQWCEKNMADGSLMTAESIKMSDGTDLKAVEQLDIPEGVTKIGDYAFAECMSLVKVTIPDGVTSIGSYAFAGWSSATNLEEVTIPDSVTKIGDYAFSNARLISVSISKGVTSIGRYAFGNCGNPYTFEVSFVVQDGWYFGTDAIDVSTPRRNGAILRDTSDDGWCTRGISRKTE